MLQKRIPVNLSCHAPNSSVQMDELFKKKLSPLIWNLVAESILTRCSVGTEWSLGKKSAVSVLRSCSLASIPTDCR